jgi:carboxymethylenebutenolidase
MEESQLVPLSLEMGPDRVLVALPPSGRGPGLILLHDAMGVDDAMRDLARIYAEEGYVVFVPDLFWLRGIEVRELVGESLEWEFWFFQDELVDRGLLTPTAPRLALDDSLEDVEHALEALRAHEACTGAVGVVGYGLGGTVAVFAAARLDVDVSVAHDPAGLDRALPELLVRSAPLLVHSGTTPREGSDALARFRAAIADRPEMHVHGYDEPRGFALAATESGAAAVLLAHSRTIRHLRRAIGPIFDLGARWDAHLRALLVDRDVAAALGGMASQPYVSFVPTSVGGRGRDELRRFYGDHLIAALPADARLHRVSRTVGPDHLVDEAVLRFTHDRVMDFLLPGVAPTGRRVELPIVASVAFRGDRVWRERVYWDQASVLAQVGRLDERALPVVGARAALEVLDASLPADASPRPRAA